MTREDVLNSVALKKSFTKDAGITIKVFDNPYFLQRLETIDSLSPCIEKFERFCSELSMFETEQDYFARRDAVKQTIIDYIKGKDAYKEFNEMTLPPINNPYPGTNLYISENDGKEFLSIDMVKANFSIMRYFSRKMFDEKTSWEEFVGLFTDLEHLKQSKYMREVIFGNLNPRRISAYEKQFMVFLAHHITSVFAKDGKTFPVYSVASDEILARIDGNMGFSLDDLQKAIDSFPPMEHYRVDLRVETFSLEKLNGIDGWCKVSYPDGEKRVEFKCVNAEIYNQVIKYYLGEPITDDDLVFYHEGRLARFLKEVDCPWESIFQLP